MCCFSGSAHASHTRIFARWTRPGRQLLAYAMTVTADAELAMILPLPVPPHPPENALRFIDLSEYPRFFEALQSGFPVPAAMPSPQSRALAVERVGNFEASFVPRLADFERLDARFRISETVWRKIPEYHDYGFAVFKLIDLSTRLASQQKIHPMAFEFPLREPDQLYFPTFHIHDGHVHANAVFDHALYYQTDRELEAPSPVHATPQPARNFVDLARAGGVVDGNLPIHVFHLFGERKNHDTILAPLFTRAA